MGGKPRPPRQPKSSSNDAPNVYGGRELKGDELRAFRVAEGFAQRLDEQHPFPRVSDDVDADAYVAAVRSWRERMEPIEKALRHKGTTARKTANAIRTFLKASEDDWYLLSDLRVSLEQGVGELAVYDMFVMFALQRACRKGSNKGDKSDQAELAAALQLLCKGLSRAKIAKLLGKDRRQVVKWLKNADAALVASMRDHLGLRRPPGK